MKTLLLILAIFAGRLALAETSNYNYKCYSYMVNGVKDTNKMMLLSVSNQESMADILNESWDDNIIGGKLNTHFNSRGSVKYYKFGANLVVEESLFYGGHQLDDGTSGGFARVEGEVEGGFSQYKFICKSN